MNKSETTTKPMTRTRIDFSNEEIETALREYAERSGEPIPQGITYVYPNERRGIVNGVQIVVEVTHPFAPLEER